MAKGGYRTFTEQGRPRFGNGDRVRVQGAAWYAINAA
jgi:hypothetical protein